MLTLICFLRHAVQIAPQRVDFGARLADHDPGPGGVDVDLEFVGVLADRDLRQPRVGELADDVLAHADVLGEVLGEVALVEPVGLPVVDVAHAHRLWVNLLSHLQLSLSFVSGVGGGRFRSHGQCDRQVAGALGDRRRPPHRARPEALDRGPFVGVGLPDDQVVLEQLVVALGVGHRRLEQLAPIAGGLARGEGEDSASLLDGLAPQVPAHHPRLAGRGAHVAGVGAHDAPPGALAACFAATAAPAGAGRSRRGGAAGSRRGFARRGFAALAAGSSSEASASAGAPRAARRPPPRPRTGLGGAPASAAGSSAAARPPRQPALAGRLRPGGPARVCGRLGCSGARGARRPRLGRARVLAAAASSGRSSSAGLTAPSPSRRARGTRASARTPRACGRPSPR